MMALLYGLTGSLWAPIVAHAVMDLAAGRLTYTVFNDTPTSQDAIQASEGALRETGS